MSVISLDKLFKTIEWVIVLCLFLSSLYFTKDTMEKYLSDRTGFSSYRENRTEFPTTVICFAPIGSHQCYKFLNSTDITAKESFVSQHNMTMKDFVNGFYSDSLWYVEYEEFKSEPFFVLGKDYNISIYDYDYNEIILNEGNNTYNELERKYLMVEQLRTVWNGICLKIKFDFFSLDLKPTFNLAFSTSLSLDDVPMPEIYLTSEDNSYGIINYGWANGEELKIDLEGVEQGIKLYASHRKKINYTSTCSKFLTTSCEKDQLAKIDFGNASDPCLAVSLPSSIMGVEQIKNLSTDCKDVINYGDSVYAFGSVLYEAEHECEKHCSEITYSGKVTWIIRSGKEYNVSWTNSFASKEVEILEEYVLMDEAGVVGGIGGTLGIFIGFSFRDVVGWILQGLKTFIQSRQNPLKSRKKSTKSSRIKVLTKELVKVEK